MALLATLVWFAGEAEAQSGKLWVDRDRAPIGPYDEPADGYERNGRSGASYQPSRQAPVRNSGGIERGSLPPLGAAPASPGYGGRGGAGAGYGAPRGGNAPYASTPAAGRASAGAGDSGNDVWRGLDFAALRTRLLKVDGGGGSLVLNDLVVDALVSNAPISGAPDEEMEDLLKMVVLYRLGRIDDLLRFIERRGDRAWSLTSQLFHARALLARGDTSRACDEIARFPISDPNVPQELLAEALVTTALCAAEKKDLHNAGFMMDLGRDKGVKAPIAWTVIEYLISGAKPNLDMPERLGVSDYLFLRLTGAPAPAKLVDKADAALVFELAHDATVPAAMRAEALERAARNGAIGGDELARAYRDIAAKAGGGNQARSDGETRALLLDGAMRGGDRQTRARIVDTLLANVRKVHLAGAFGPLLAPVVHELQPGPDIAWFAPRAVEVALLAHDAKLLETWLLFARDGGRDAYAAAEWLPLAGLIEAGLVPIDDASEMALRMAKGRQLDGTRLHLLASALDALAVNVPIPLWNEAANHPQPAQGVLPPGGTLSELKKARDEGRAGEALLLSLEAVGAIPPDELHMLALGDIVRSLHKTGFKREAGWFAFEALYRLWPTGQTRIAAR